MHTVHDKSFLFSCQFYFTELIFGPS